MTELHTLTLAEAAEAISNGDLSSVDLTQSYLDQIQAPQSSLAAYVTVNSEIALQEAQDADNRLRKGEAGPLNGMPIAYKDVIHTRGLKTTSHSKLLKDFVPDSDAFVVSQLKKAGTVNLGKLATHEFAFGGPSHDLPFPPARNPGQLNTSLADLQAEVVRQ